MPNIPWRGAEFSALMGIHGARGLTKGAERLRSVSVPRTPVETSHLRNSAQVWPANPSDLEAAVTFNTPYAVRQHEELGYYHDDGEAKYLERPLVEHADEITAIVAAEIRRGTNG